LIRFLYEKIMLAVMPSKLVSDARNAMYGDLAGIIEFSSHDGDIQVGINQGSEIPPVNDYVLNHVRNGTTHFTIEGQQYIHTYHKRDDGLYEWRRTKRLHHVS
jgi:hypothetical protein